MKNLEGYKILFHDDHARLKLAEPLNLLKDIDTFNRHKRDRAEQYRNLCVILRKAASLKKEPKYHFFGMFLNELYLQYSDADFPEGQNDIQEEVLKSQLNLLYQFMLPSYYVEQMT